MCISWLARCSSAKSCTPLFCRHELVSTVQKEERGDLLHLFLVFDQELLIQISLLDLLLQAILKLQ